MNCHETSPLHDLAGGPWGVYVHLPWCRYRCPYCAFAVDARKDPPHQDYQDRLLEEWCQTRGFYPDHAPTTVYFGGGTPSRSPVSTFAAMLDRIQPASNAEVTAEANPEDCTDALFLGWRDAGINRVSLGVQSFAELVARRLGRTRAARAAMDAVSRAVSVFSSVSVDLIFGGPGSSWEGLHADLEVAVGLGVQHVSLYGLTLEEGTPFERAQVAVADEEGWRAQYDGAVGFLASRGIARYEVSNFARPGHASRHNRLYWAPWSWAGLGAGAHSWRTSGQRVANTRSVDRYLRGDFHETVEPVDQETRGWDLLWSMLRTTEGIDPARYAALSGLTLFCPPILIAQGALSWLPNGRLVLTDQGFPIADMIASRLYEACLLRKT